MNDFLYNELVNPDVSFEENRIRLLKFLGNKSDDTTITNYDDLLSLFEKDSVESHEVLQFNLGNSINRWSKSFARKTIDSSYIYNIALEPFVRRYVIAINNIGIRTFFSCDGWHKKLSNKFIVGFKERNSMVWHKIILKLFASNYGNQVDL